ncbi:MAG: pyridoxal phosphate-dependent decarboxylase family protein, partial [Chitinophagales bacterium]
SIIGLRKPQKMANDNSLSIASTTNRQGLDSSLSEFSEQLSKACEVVINRFKGLDEAKAYSGFSPATVESWFDENLPSKGMDFDELMALIQSKVIDTATMNMGPYMYAYVMTGGNQISIIAELLATTINQNVGKWHLAPSISELEKRVVNWGAEFVGYPSTAGGVLVSGGSAANLTSLTVARNLFLEKENVRQKGLFGMPTLRMYASSEVHGCVDKSAESLGIGSNNLQKVSTNDDFTINTSELIERIEADITAGFRPFCIVGNAGTVNTGAIDDLDKLAEIAQKYQMWFHVDGAYGGLAAAVYDRKPLFKGMEKADSLALDFHKWLYQPFEGGCALIKNWNTLHKSFYTEASYLSSDKQNDGRLDFNEYGFQLSRNAKSLKIYMTFKAYGADRLRKVIAEDIENTRYLASIVEKASDFRLSSKVVLGIVCFQFLGKNDGTDTEYVNDLNRRIIPALERDGRMFIAGTTLKGKSVIRACLINHRQQHKHLARLLEVIREVGNGLEV